MTSTYQENLLKGHPDAIWRRKWKSFHGHHSGCFGFGEIVAFAREWRCARVWAQVDQDALLIHELPEYPIRIGHIRLKTLLRDGHCDTAW
jgi:hypothetical protein